MVILNVALAQALDIQEEQGFILAGSEAQMQATPARHPELIEPSLSILDRKHMSEPVHVNDDWDGV